MAWSITIEGQTSSPDEAENALNTFRHLVIGARDLGMNPLVGKVKTTGQGDLTLDDIFNEIEEETGVEITPTETGQETEEPSSEPEETTLG